MKYLDADKLIAEINALKERYGSCVAKNETEKCYKGGRLIGYEDALYKIASLQQEQQELDFEKEANECWDYVFSAIGWDENSLMTMNHKEFLAFARHFYELGLNARKEE